MSEEVKKYLNKLKEVAPNNWEFGFGYEDHPKSSHYNQFCAIRRKPSNATHQFACDVIYIGIGNTIEASYERLKQHVENDTRHEEDRHYYSKSIKDATKKPDWKLWEVNIARWNQ